MSHFDVHKVLSRRGGFRKVLKRVTVEPQCFGSHIVDKPTVDDLC